MIKHQQYASITIFSILLISFFSSCSVTKKENKPNVIVILTDDQGYGDLSAHENPIIKTPNMDKLRNESIRLTDFHVAPMCSPTRGQLMTGWDAMRNGCSAVCEGRSMPHRDLPMMPEFFQKSGYNTGHFGKWHIGDSYPYRPQDRGFDETLHFRAWGLTALADYWGNGYFDPVLNLNGEDKKYEGYCTDIFFDEAIKWMKKSKDVGKPFFTYLATNTPHWPDIVDERYSTPYKKLGKYENIEIPANYYGMIVNIDDNLKKLDDFLTENDLKENTILIYMSDNGTQNERAKLIHNSRMREKKTSVYEGGHRVPFFIRWPSGKIKHSTDVDQLTVVQDVLPTLIDLCNLNNGELPQTDGVSLKPLFVDPKVKLADRKKVIQYRNKGKDSKWDNTVILWNKWRLTAKNELYDISSDPHQDNNIAEQNPNIVKEMTAYYDRWYNEAKELYEKKRIITVGSPKANPTMLYANDWNGWYCDNPAGLFKGKAQGYFDIDIEAQGAYEITLSRWPFEAEIPLNSYDENFTIKNRKAYEAAKPIVKAQLKVGDFDKTIETADDDTLVKFTASLNPGVNKLEGLFLDKQDAVICGAMYIKVSKK